ncbi:SDR family oxidoreductase [Lysinibacillus antri]|uniref:SDR family oxidoreductase n=1 Tax=Lysinibacillus antri TaxID=2498145 RepID=A0A432LC61_9BACI|nr:SDR family oxidoreductase [Lysinibacillus antri]RUL53092.1 SDR family oxidoreductase [Lysinibacillus antri]
MGLQEWNMDGKVCLITGANAGIGKRAALQLAKLGAEVIIVCRNEVSGKMAAKEIITKTENPRVTFLKGDLSSQTSIHQLSREIHNQFDRLHVLIHNAANFDLSMKKPKFTEEGIETIFATNHLGPVLLSNLLVDQLKEEKGRIITIASKGLLVYPFMTVDFQNLNGEQSFSPTKAYYQSKLAQLMFTYKAAEILQPKGITVNAIRVPSVQLDEGRHEEVSALLRTAYKIKRKFSITPEQMARTYVYLAASPDLEQITGKYFDEENNMVHSSKKSYDPSVINKLWEVSNQLTKIEQW